MKKLRNIACMALALVATIAVSVVFTACGTKTVTLSQAEGAEAASLAASNYQNSHKNYENFADMTLTAHYEESSSEVKELTYKKSRTDEKTTTSEFTETKNGVMDYVIKVKNVGDNLFLYANVEVTEKAKEYAVNYNQLLQTTTTDKVTTRTYTMAIKEVDNEVMYYATKYEKVVEDGEEANAVVTREYYQFANRNEYVSEANDLLETLNEMVENSYFAAFSSSANASALSAVTTYKKTGNKVVMNIEAVEPSVSNGVTTTTTSTMKTTFVKDQIDGLVIKVSVSSTAGMNATMDTSSQVKHKSDDITLPDLAGYKLVTNIDFDID